MLVFEFIKLICLVTKMHKNVIIKHSPNIPDMLFPKKSKTSHVQTCE